MADTATKLGEVTKKFKAVNKDVIARLAEYGEVVKSSTSVITDEQAAMVVDILTQDNPFTAEEIEELKTAAIAKKETGFSYPAERILENWKLILLNQFHDILPGSSG